MIGSSIAHFRITSKLGEGGMGEVYRARDERLNRDVAIKLLPETFSSDPERLARFQREAELLASLNHPNIGQVYGLEEKDGRRALVLELIEGEELDAWITRGALPLEQALQLALQIAEALEAAHGKGIVHRDLKPANVKVTPDGTVKVLDFGLAKAMDPASGSDSATQLAHSPTMTIGTTLQGVILGTASYMSPEQAAGQPVDARADVWSFGVVLYEMLTGRRLFAGETVSHILAGVLKEEADLSVLPDETPPRVVRLLRRCLGKKPRERLQAIGDARLVIEEVLGGDAGDEPSRTPAAAAPAQRSMLAWLAVVTVVGLGAGLLGYFASGRAPGPAPPMRLTIQLAPDQVLPPDSSNSILAFSPDGGSVVFSGREEGRQFLLRADLQAGTVEPIPGTDSGDSVFFSPDGRWIGFASRGQLMKVAVEGGNPFPLGSARGSGGATWLPDDTIVFAPIYSDGLFRVSAEGGDPERLTTPDRADGELGHWWPQHLIGGRYVIFTAFRTPVDTSRIGVLDLQTNTTRSIVEGGFFGRYVATGHLLYGKGHRVFALPFDAGTATVQGTPVAVLDDVRASQTGGYAEFAVSSGGMLAYVTESRGNPPRELVWLDRTGRATPATSERRAYLTVALSPDDRRAALTIQDQSRDLWTYSFERGTLSRLTSGADTEFDPVWSPDGQELYYVFDRPPFDLYRIDAGVPDSGRPIWETPAELDTTAPAVSPDGRTIAFTISELQTRDDLHARSIEGNDPSRAFRKTRAEEKQPSFSPDGRWVAYQSDETGRAEIYVERFPEQGERVQITADGGSEPRWARNGEIFYRHDNEMRVVSTRLEESRFDAPTTLFAYPIVPGTGDDSKTYDVTSDGKRILAVTFPQEMRPRRVEVVTDWTAELERLVP